MSREVKPRSAWRDRLHEIIFEAETPLGKTFDVALLVVVAYIGVMGPQDGVNLVLDAADHIVRVLGRQDVTFVLMGSGDCHADLVAQRDALGLQDYVELPDPPDAPIAPAPNDAADDAVDRIVTGINEGALDPAAVDDLAAGLAQVLPILGRNHAGDFVIVLFEQLFELGEGWSGHQCAELGASAAGQLFA